MTSYLNSQRILITREQSQATVFSKTIKAEKGIPIEVPLLKINCVAYHHTLNLRHYDWIFFTSANGVKCFFECVLQANQPLPLCNIGVVGPKTEQVLNSYGYDAEFIPSTYHADTMAEEFLKNYPTAGPILLVRGNRSRDVLPKVLASHLISYDSIEIYETTTNTNARNELNRVLYNEDIDFITFMSPSTVDAFMNMIDNNLWKRLKHHVVSVCIGTTTEKRAHEHGICHTIIPEEFTIEGMIERMKQYIAQKG